jgi:hypothetical protein
MVILLQRIWDHRSLTKYLSRRLLYLYTLTGRKISSCELAGEYLEERARVDGWRSAEQIGI